MDTRYKFDRAELYRKGFYIFYSCFHRGNQREKEKERERKKMEVATLTIEAKNLLTDLSPRLSLSFIYHYIVILKYRMCSNNSVKEIIRKIILSFIY